MAWYKAGVVAFTRNTNVVEGINTQFAYNVRVGFCLYGPDNKIYEVVGVESNTRLTLATNYTGSSVINSPYSIWQTQGEIPELAARASELLDTFSPLRDNFDVTYRPAAELVTYRNEAAISAGIATERASFIAQSEGQAAQSAITADEHRIAASESVDEAADLLAQTQTARNAAAGSANESGVSAAESEVSRLASEAANIEAHQTASELGDIALAHDNAQLANSSRIAAEAARDAAIIQPGLYVTEELGRAEVADGETFKVQGAGNIAAFEYRRDDVDNSTLIASYASIAAINDSVLLTWMGI